MSGRPREHDDKIEEVLALLKRGWTVRAVALSMGLSKSTVGRMKKGWRDDRSNNT